MLAALLANIRTPSESHTQEKRRSIFWMEAQHPEVFEEKRRLARELKEAMERLRFLPEDHELRPRFEAKVAAYRRDGRPGRESVRRRLDYLEIALNPEVSEDLLDMAAALDDEDMMLLFGVVL